MKKRKFLLKTIMKDCANDEYIEVESNDYDEEFGLVRYNDVLYDWELGLWCLRLKSIRECKEEWRVYGSGVAIPDTTKTTLIKNAISSKYFLDSVKKARERAKEKGKQVVNKREVYSLFEE